MKTMKEIKRMIKTMEGINNNPNTTDILRHINQGSINALEWVIREE